MSEELKISGKLEKVSRYEILLPQLEALISGEDDLIANLANICAALNETFDWWWTGFYLVKNNELVLGPFQGPIACTRIKKGKGVCGTAWEMASSQLVPDVNQFPGHIACSSSTRSEVVIPVFKNGIVVAVLDVDSEHPAYFNETDVKFLEKIAQLTASVF